MPGSTDEAMDQVVGQPQVVGRHRVQRRRWGAEHASLHDLASAKPRRPQRQVSSRGCRTQRLAKAQSMARHWRQGAWVSVWHAPLCIHRLLAMMHLRAPDARLRLPQRKLPSVSAIRDCAKFRTRTRTQRQALCGTRLFYFYGAMFFAATSVEEVETDQSSRGEGAAEARAYYWCCMQYYVA